MDIRRSFNQWRQVRRTYNELSRLTERELNDLGIARSDIGRIARSASKF